MPESLPSTAPTSGDPEPPPVELSAALAEAGLRLERAGRRADVVLAAPERRNAMAPSMWQALATVGGWLRDRADVVVVRADGPSFCAGLDRRAFTTEGIPGEIGLFAIAALDDAQADATIASYQEGFSVWSEGPFLSIASVQGHAVGGGFQLALACDLRIAAEDARFAMREPAYGIVPDLGGTGRLVAAVGLARAIEICATTRWVEAAEAERIGLVSSVVPVDGLRSATDELVAAVLANPADAVLATRDLLRGAAGRTPAEQRAAERTTQLARLRSLSPPS